MTAFFVSLGSNSSKGSTTEDIAQNIAQNIQYKTGLWHACMYYGAQSTVLETCLLP